MHAPADNVPSSQPVLMRFLVRSGSRPGRCQIQAAVRAKTGRGCFRLPPPSPGR